MVTLNHTRTLFTKRSVLDCDDEQSCYEHGQELVRISDEFNRLENCACKMIVYDKSPKGIERGKADVVNCHLHNIFTLLESYDFSGGVDVNVTETSLFEFRLFGSSYLYKDNKYYVTDTRVLVCPYDENTGVWLEIANAVKNSTDVKIGKYRFTPAGMKLGGR